MSVLCHQRPDRSVSNPPIALDKYQAFTIGEAQLAAFQSNMTFGSICCFVDIIKLKVLSP